jgi:hypothetical protein
MNVDDLQGRELDAMVARRHAASIQVEVELQKKGWKRQDPRARVSDCNCGL